MSKKIPTKDECFRIMQDHNMLANIVNHSIQVMNVSMAIYNSLRDTGDLDKNLITASALLHDIAKTRAIHENKKKHDLMGGVLLRNLGYDAVASIVESHVHLKNVKFDGPLEEREIIFYSDKRVMHDTIVTIDQRFDDLLKRYGKTPEAKIMIEENRDFSLKLEKKVDRFLIIPLDKLFPVN